MLDNWKVGDRFKAKPEQIKDLNDEYDWTRTYTVTGTGDTWVNAVFQRRGRDHESNISKDRIYKVNNLKFIIQAKRSNV